MTKKEKRERQRQMKLSRLSAEMDEVSRKMKGLNTESHEWDVLFHELAALSGEFLATLKGD